MELRDAHCHYQFAEVPYAAVEQARADGVGQAMINGSAPADWPDVAALARRDPRNRDHALEFTFLGLTHWQDGASLLGALWVTLRITALALLAARKRPPREEPSSGLHAVAHGIVAHAIHDRFGAALRRIGLGR